MKSLGGGDQHDIFNWDSKYAGAYVLLSQRGLLNKDINFELYKQEAERFICKILPDTPSKSTHHTQEQPTTRNRHNILAHNLRQVHESHITHIHCGNSVTIVPNALISVSKKHVDFILGDNPRKMLYMVGFGPSLAPVKLH
ncbi:hypothetical protein Bca52824_004914 [Brassica carinata]|uniref:cellulase n=1 Tax=Brassica carinata TaxID=52824 RepID=A0A8X7WMI3_BRACI|nr:hypothetical protein Bca52824_004914 [Brassica carinata]